MKNKILLSLLSIIAIIGGVIAISAFEAHIINVTADITNGLELTIEEIPFGTVLPQEYLEKDFTIGLSQGFLDTPRLLSINYDIKQKPKPKWPEPVACGQSFKDVVGARTYCHSNPQNLNCCYYSLCPFLSKNDADPEDNNDISAPSYFQGNHCITSGEASGKLDRETSDISDKWKIDLKVPPVYGYVAQDWPADCPTIPVEAKYGCDLWIEVTGIMTTEGPECVPQTEVCNGLDDDCDGLVDEGCGCVTNEDCDDGLYCNGIEFCNASNVCEFAGSPCPGPDGDFDCSESCNETNDDCSANDPNGSACLGGTCSSGTCIGVPFEDVCNDGLDNDGDATIDCDDADCFGNPVCVDADGDGYASDVDCNDSNPSIHPDAPELCNGVDDDCDGVIDNGDPGAGAGCSTGLLGICNAGLRHCVDGALTCVQNIQPSPETCNGLDDDCDGAVDEGNPGGGGACNTGLPGICSAGTAQCNAGILQCVQNVLPITEICGNGLDDDCDGQVDEGCINCASLNCDDGNQCTNDSCNPLTGCFHTNVDPGTGCFNAGCFLMMGSCQAGSCVCSMTPLCSTDADCADTDLCNIDTCYMGLECRHTPKTGTLNCGSDAYEVCNPANGSTFCECYIGTYPSCGIHLPPLP